MFVYNDKEYGSKAEVVRELYDLGQTSLDAVHKKDLAEKLGMTIQTVHATLMKHIGKASSPKTVSVKKVDSSVVKKEIKKIKSTKKAIIFNEKSDEVKEELMKNKNRIKVDFAPNQWGLPITTPPIYVIDEKYDPNWTPKEDLIERSWK